MSKKGKEERASGRSPEVEQLKRYAQDLNRTISELKSANIELEKASLELEQNYQTLKSLSEISRKVGELSSIGEIVGFITRKAGEVTRLEPLGMLVLSSGGDGLFFRANEKKRVKDPGLIEKVASLTGSEELSAAETAGLRLFEGMEEGGGRLLVPAIHGGLSTVAALIISLGPEEPRREDLNVVSLILSQTAGALKRAVADEERLEDLKERYSSRARGGDIIGNHRKIMEVQDLIESIADSDATVLIQGESGTGKELVARRIHQLSSRGKSPFVVINCAAFPETLLESELFGHVEGAFTGAVRDKRGCFERADTGTIFLDEIGEIPSTAQVKLLRVLQFREFQRLGDEKNIKVDVRVLAATSRDLKEEIQKGEFREDLYYRLHVIPIELPPLKERISDLPALAEHFLRQLETRTGKEVSGLDQEALDVMMNYHWPGNIRELENVIEHAFILSKDGIVRKRDLPGELTDRQPRRDRDYRSLQEHEKRYIMEVLKHCRGNKIKAARLLNISRSTLYRKLEAYDIK